MNADQLTEALEDKPLFQALHMLESYLFEQQEKLGTDTLPNHEPIVLETAQHLGFAVNDMEAIHPLNNGKVRVNTNVLGLTGANGVMPQHYSEMILSRLRAKDAGLANFLNIFNHRLLSLYFRTWKKFQRPVGLSHELAGQPSDVKYILDALTGRDDNRRWAGFHVRHVRSREAMRAVFSAVAGTDVEIRELRGAWMPLRKSEQTKLSKGDSAQHAQLGRSATLGKRVWNVNAGIEVVCIITDPARVSDLLPGGARNEALKQQARAFLPPSLSVRWQIEAEQTNLPVMTLSKGPGRLGRGGVLMPKKKPTPQRVTIAV